MAHKSRLAAKRGVERPLRRRHSLPGALAIGVLAILGYAMSITPLDGPGAALYAEIEVHPAPTEPKIAVASLSYSGSHAIITGSVEHLFNSPSFVGPNRSDKTDRYKPAVDVAEFAQGFEDVRVRLAAMRAPDADPMALGQSRIEIADKDDADGDADEPRISVAAIDPRQGASALGAIETFAPKGGSADSDLPTPSIASEQLAYARANEPASDGYLTRETVQVANDKQMWCLATAIYFEARGESYRGQVAVAQVVLNRVKDHRYPDTVCAVVFQNQHRRNACQFSFACDGIPETVNDRKSWAQAEEIADKVVEGELYLAEVNDATHYHATYVRPAWAPRMNKVTQIGLHVFYKFKSGWLFG